MKERYVPKLTIPTGIKIEIATEEELQKITGYKMYQGIMALVLNGVADLEKFQVSPFH